MTFFSSKDRPAGASRIFRAFDAKTLLSVTTFALIFLLAIFYIVTMMNMGIISTRVGELDKGPYSVTVAAGRVETDLVQLKTLSERLVYVRTPEAIDRVESEYAVIDTEILAPLSVLKQQFSSSSDEVGILISNYQDLKLKQEQLIALCRDPETTTSEVELFVINTIHPLQDDMIEGNATIIEESRGSFTSLYELAAKACLETMVSATIIMAAVLIALAIFLVIIERRNRQRDDLRKDLEFALAAARHANAAKSQFLASMSHDIRTPCSAIVGLTEIAERHVDNPERVQECLTKITLSSHHLLSLINDVLDMSKIENGQLVLADEAFVLRDLISVVDVITQPQAKTKDLVFEVDAEQLGDLCIRGDALRLKQLLLNLVGNAVKYTEPGGHVYLRVSYTQQEASSSQEPSAQTSANLERVANVNAEEGEEAVSGTAGSTEALLVTDAAADETFSVKVVAPSESVGDADVSGSAGGESEGVSVPMVVVRFEVQDDGIGMTREFVERIFDPFEREQNDETRDIEGTGLGMAIAKNIVDQVGGSISVDSERHKGTKFVVEVPFEVECATSETSSRERPAAVPMRVDFSGVRALLAEDDDINAEIACDMLGRANVEVERMCDGEEAVSRFTSMPDGWFDIVFMDVQMPRMGGLQASKALHEFCAQQKRMCPPIVTMTANAYAEDRIRAIEAGMVGYLVKPFGFDDVCRALEEYTVDPVEIDGPQPPEKGEPQ